MLGLYGWIEELPEPPVTEFSSKRCVDHLISWDGDFVPQTLKVAEGYDSIWHQFFWMLHLWRKKKPSPGSRPATIKKNMVNFPLEDDFQPLSLKMLVVWFHQPTKMVAKHFQGSPFLTYKFWGPSVKLQRPKMGEFSGPPKTVISPEKTLWKQAKGKSPKG